MKKVFSILIILCVTVISQAQTKVAHINSTELMQSMPEADTISMKLEKIRQTWETLLAEKQKETQVKYQSLMEIIDDESIPTSVKEVKTQEIDNLQKQLQEMQKTGSEAMQKEQESLLTPLYARVKETIAAVAKANGYAYVMDSSEGGGMIYSDSSYDLMQLVKAKLGLK
jgi:outer membrane protein|tara:strand:+ start:5080 stop:5589 length:510 start_codon:yes stop_codon:yes gene_type:complete